MDASAETLLLSRMESAILSMRDREIQANMENIQGPRPSDVAAPAPAGLAGAQDDVRPIDVPHVTPVPTVASPGPMATTPAPSRPAAQTTLAGLMAKMNAAKATQQADIESLARTVDDVSTEAAAALDAASNDLEARRKEIAEFAASIRPGSNGG